MVCRVERATVNCSFDAASRLCDALGVRVALRLEAPMLTDRRRQREPVHARCSAYVRRRLEARGWTVAGEVEIVLGSSHGWIDLLAWHPPSRTVLVVEVKTELHDLGQVERTVGWYEREAWGAARRQGWRPAQVVSILLALMTAAVDDRIVSNAAALVGSFPVRATRLARWLERPDDGWQLGARGLALIDPRSRRHAWLGPSRSDGRRTPSPYLDYSDAVRRLSSGRPTRPVGR
jgi:hypothetical protein